MVFRPVTPRTPRYAAANPLDFRPLERGIDAGINRNALLEQREIDEQVRAQNEAFRRDQMAAQQARFEASQAQSRELADRTYGLQSARLDMARAAQQREADLRARKQEMINRVIGGGAPVAQPAPTLTGDVQPGPVAQPQIPQSQPQPGLNLSQQGRQAVVLDYELTGGKNIASIIQNDQTKRLSPAQKAVDTQFAKEYGEFISTGSADISKNLEQLDLALGELRKGGVTGVPESLAIRSTTVGNVLNPRAVETRALVTEVAQRNLRLVLGPAFTAKEGEALIERAYDPSADEKVNIRRVTRLRKSIARAYEQKRRAASYYEQNGTLQGFKGKLPTIQSIERDAGLTRANDMRVKNKNRRVFNPQTGKIE